MPRTAILIALMAASASVVCNAERAESTPAQDREIHNAGGEDWQMSWRVPLDRLERASKWNSGSEPPLSIGEAVTKAREYLRSHGLPDQLPLASAELHHVEDTAPSC